MPDGGLLGTAAGEGLERPSSTPKDWRLSAEEERLCVLFDPWGERDATYRVIRDGFCVVRGPHECAICFGTIVKGERVWFRAEQDERKMKTFRFCPECCWCIAHRYDEHDWDADPDGPDPWERMDIRWDVGRQRAEERRAHAL
jgi:hypothetical protein